MKLSSLLKHWFRKHFGTIRRKRQVPIRPAVESLEERVTPTTTINVGTYTDAVLRAVLSAAVTDSASNNPVNIDFTAGPGTILLTGGVLDLNEGSGTGLITVNGTQQNITINAQGNSTVFEVFSGSQVAIGNLTIEGGATTIGNGGGILNNGGTLAVSNCIFSGNSAMDGGAIYNGGTLTLTTPVSPSTPPTT